MAVAKASANDRGTWRRLQELRFAGVATAEAVEPKVL